MSRIKFISSGKRAFKDKRLWIIAVLFFLCAIYPIQTTIVPDWRIRVVEENENPVRRLKVRQAWKHYSLEITAGEHIEDRWTDEEGFVCFPKRTIRSSLLMRLLAPIINTVLTWEHTGFGRSASITIWGPDGTPVSTEYKPDQPLAEKLVLPRSNPSIKQATF